MIAGRSLLRFVALAALLAVVSGCAYNSYGSGGYGHSSGYGGGHSGGYYEVDAVAYGGGPAIGGSSFSIGLGWYDPYFHTATYRPLHYGYYFYPSVWFDPGYAYYPRGYDYFYGYYDGYHRGFRIGYNEGFYSGYHHAYPTYAPYRPYFNDHHYRNPPRPAYSPTFADAARESVRLSRRPPNVARSSPDPRDYELSRQRQAKGPSARPSAAGSEAARLTGAQTGRVPTARGSATGFTVDNGGRTANLNRRPSTTRTTLPAPRSAGRIGSRSDAAAAVRPSTRSTSLPLPSRSATSAATRSAGSRSTIRPATRSTPTTARPSATATRSRPQVARGSQTASRPSSIRQVQSRPVRSRPVSGSSRPATVRQFQSRPVTVPRSTTTPRTRTSRPSAA
ncbi:MAG: hypothetical protein AAGE01_22745, partial [Pseudomonadota bacterium]